MRLFLAFLIAITSFANAELIPAERLVSWVPGESVGVRDGIDRFYIGGANQRVTYANVRDYGAAGNNEVTTGSITSGETALTVADPSSFSVGNPVRVVQVEIQSLEITSTATESGIICVNAPLLGADPENMEVSIVNGDTAAQIAAKIRAKSFKTVTTGGSGATVTFTQKDYYPVSRTVRLNEPAQEHYSIDSITYVGTRVQQGVFATPHAEVFPGYYAQVTAIAGNVLTLAVPAVATVTNALVQHDDTPAFRMALESGVGDCVFAPAGTYVFYDSLSSAYFNNRTLRGELVNGEIATFYDQRADACISVGSSDGGPPAGTTTSVASGLSKGSTAITLAGDMGDLAAGSLMLIYVENDETLPVVSVYGFNIFVPLDSAPTNQMVRILTRDGNNVTFEPPLLSSYGGGALGTQIQRAALPRTQVGLEDFEVNSQNYHPGAYNNVLIQKTYNSWIRNVRIKNAKNYPLSASANLRVQISGCTILGPQNTGTNGAGILYFGHSGLIENNVIGYAFPTIEMNGGSAGNAWLYNYDPTANVNSRWITNHGPHNQFNLFEGNVIGHQQSDGYFGSEAYLTMFRNFFSPTGSGVNIKRFNRKTSVVGNLMPNLAGAEYAGYPWMGNGTFSGEIDFGSGERWRDWKRTWEVTAKASDDSGEITLQDTGSGSRLWFGNQVIRVNWTQSSVTSLKVVNINGDGTVAQVVRTGNDPLPAIGTEGIVWAGAHYEGVTTPEAGSYSEIDRDTGATLVSKGNRDIGVGYEDNLGADVLPNSLAYTAKPPWWPADMAWPPFDPTDESTANAERIPAGYRYINGLTAEIPPPAAVIKRLRPGGKDIFLGTPAKRLGIGDN